MFSKWKSRLNATRFEFMVHVHSLQPWPAGSKAIAIGWQRGKKRRGATNSVAPLSKDGAGTVVRFNEKFSLTSTLYKVCCAQDRGGSGGWRGCVAGVVVQHGRRSRCCLQLPRAAVGAAEPDSRVCDSRCGAHAG
jgi:hypothetical protein